MLSARCLCVGGRCETHKQRVVCGHWQYGSCPTTRGKMVVFNEHHLKRDRRHPLVAVLVYSGRRSPQRPNIIRRANTCVRAAWFCFTVPRMAPCTTLPEQWSSTRLPVRPWNAGSRAMSHIVRAIIVITAIRYAATASPACESSLCVAHEHWPDWRARGHLADVQTPWR